jgi:dCMP deaminase
MRPSLEDTFMSLAKVWSMRSTCSSRAMVGAVLVNQNGQVIASGYNGSPHGVPHCDADGCILDSDGHCTRAIHAEENVILQCAMTGVSTVGCTLYTTHSPCIRCAMRLLQAGVAKVGYLQAYGSDVAEINQFLTNHGIRVTRIVPTTDWLEELED